MVYLAGRIASWGVTAFRRRRWSCPCSGLWISIPSYGTIRTRSGRNVFSTMRGSCAGVTTLCPSRQVPNCHCRTEPFSTVVITNRIMNGFRQADVHRWWIGPGNGVSIHGERTAAIPVGFPTRIQLWHQPEARVWIYTSATTLHHPGQTSILISSFRSLQCYNLFTGPVSDSIE